MNDFSVYDAGDLIGLEHVRALDAINGDETKPPKAIYLQWDADPLAEVTWSEDKINNDDICYTRTRNNNARIVELQSQLASRDALIERLVEAGSWLANLAIDTELRVSSVWKRSRDLAENDWDKGIAEYRASNKESVE